MRELVQKITAAAADLRRLEEGWIPSDAELRDAVILEDWMIGGDPVTGQTVFWGRSIGHPILGDRLITTSPLIWISEDRTIARTLSRWYRLGRAANLSLEPSAWPAAGFVDTEIGCFMKPEVGYATKAIWA